MSDMTEAPGHTDLMISPEALAAYLDANPPPAPDPRDAEIARLKETLRFLLHSCGGFAGGPPPYYRPSEEAVNAARNALHIPHR